MHPYTELKRKLKSLGSQKLLAKYLGYSPAYVNDVLVGRRKMSENFAKKLGYERKWVKVK